MDSAAAGCCSSLLLVALLIDARHLRRGAIAVSEPGEVPSGSAPGVTASPGLIADQWTARLPTWRAGAATTAAGAPTAARWATAAMAAACALLAYMIRDVLVLLDAHARQSDESRAAAMARGRLALCALHHERASAIEAAATRHYLTATTPQGAVVDLGEFVLTFAPGNLAGAAGGRFGRQVVLRNVAPELNLGRLTAGKSVILANGSTLARLGEDELAAASLASTPTGSTTLRKPRRREVPWQRVQLLRPRQPSTGAGVDDQRRPRRQSLRRAHARARRARLRCAQPLESRTGIRIG
jgi:hypothetical protein